MTPEAIYAVLLPLGDETPTTRGVEPWKVITGLLVAVATLVTAWVMLSL
jgi:hypothetical protein